MSRSGGVTGLRPRVREVEAAPGTPAHRAAAELLATPTGDAPPSRTRDGFVYRVEIVSGDDRPGPLTFRDPVPSAFAALLDALDALDGPG